MQSGWVVLNPNKLKEYLNNNKDRRYHFLSFNCFTCLIDGLIFSGYKIQKEYGKSYNKSRLNKDDSLLEVMCSLFNQQQENKQQSSELLSVKNTISLVMVKLDEDGYYDHLLLYFGGYFYDITQKSKTIQRHNWEDIANNYKAFKVFKIYREKVNG